MVRVNSEGAVVQLKEAAKQTAAEEAARQAAKEAAKPKDDSVDDELEIKFKQEVLDINHAVKEIERRAKIEVTELNRVRASLRKFKVDAVNRNSARAKRKAELKGLAKMVLSNIRNHKHAWLFMKPADAQALGLRDCHDVIWKPMDLGRIQRRMDATAGTGYTNVKEVCDDVRLIFINALAYNDASSDAHRMAKVISEKFEEQWMAFVEPKRQEEELKRTLELLEADVLKFAERNPIPTVESNLGPLFLNLNKQLEDLNQKVTPPGSTMSMEERSELRDTLGRLSGDRLKSAMHILAQENSGFNVNTDEALLLFNATHDEVTFNIYGLDSPALWRLYRYLMPEPQSRPDDAVIIMTTLLSGRKRCREVETPST